MEQGAGGNGGLGGEVEDGGVAVLAGDLEVDCKDESFEGFVEGLGAAERGGDSVVRAGEEVVEAVGGAEPVDAGGEEEVGAGGELFAAGEVGGGAEGEEVAGRGGPAVGSGVEVDVAEGSAVDRLLPPGGGHWNSWKDWSFGFCRRNLLI